MNTAALHHIDCEWQYEQYDHECTCGAAGPDRMKRRLAEYAKLVREFQEQGLSDEEADKHAFRAIILRPSK
jgi:hypothetical protein